MAFKLIVEKERSTSTFGSNKAKLFANEPDILDIGDPNSDIYLSDIDGPFKNQAEKPKLNSVIVKPFNTKTKSTSLYRKRKHTLDKPHGSSVDDYSRVRIAGPNSTNQNSVSDIKVCIVNNTTSQLATTKQTETRGTQTDRIGPCKCARQQQQRNQRKRSENKTNKQIVDTLERVNIIKFST